ncbi:MAG TPA: hypothetical protein DEG17_14355 [Cyanobacteria bacterium UBA11149]|nr:hypothetical protein [Cyanobacteria bacterium UBA11367]HBE60848.1 hypothetical protein [Cyanobacteria bacterium UBA11366]HBK62396.1 hypothetical protein [Cyanobacteria bacterium UBA11166]HBR72183.1 hypothetical protein [Cyanobacteria bacterium UBA11159]HBS69759.1 hypothetical protein [Cyanobacteria bacterium UBA11153]HBW90020.1 hypothetical protein [Cyanobacteria bacterium UBA11149]HCA93129.1 hypothetical protein [Cyanobacteria bacterium UBA9226]
MELQSPWRDSESSNWLLALSLPTLSWATPFRPLMGLPDKLLEHPEVWTSIYTQAANEHETRLRLRDWEIGVDGARGNLMREVVTKALLQLAEQMGHSVAVDLERWVLFHFFCEEAEAAMRMWGVVLRYAYLPEDSRRGRKKVPPPPALMPLLPEIWDLVNYERRREIRDALMRSAPPPAYEQAPCEKLEHCYEATLISWAFNQALTLKALQTIVNRLNKTECQEIVAWAEVQLKTMDSRHGPANAQKLCGDKYLQVEFPCTNMPSVL